MMNSEYEEVYAGTVLRNTVRTIGKTTVATPDEQCSMDEWVVAISKKFYGDALSDNHSATFGPEELRKRLGGARSDAPQVIEPRWRSQAELGFAPNETHKLQLTER